LVVVLLGDKLVETRNGVEENGLEWQLGAIVRVKMEFGRSWARVRKSKSSQTGWKHGRGGSQAGISEKFPAIGVRVVAVTRNRRLLLSTQTKSPLGGAVVAKLTSALLRVKIGRLEDWTLEAGADPSRWSGWQSGWALTRRRLAATLKS